MAQDDELADANRDRMDKAQPYRPSVREFGVVEDLLAQLVDATRQGNVNFIQANQDPKRKKRVPPAKPVPRPETAYDRAKERWALEDVRAILEKATPQDTPDDTG